MRGYLVFGGREIEREQFDGLKRSGSRSVDLVNDELVAAEGDVGAVDEGVALDGVVWGEVGNVAVVDGCLESSQVEVVSKVEQMVWCCCHFFFLFFFFCRSKRESLVLVGGCCYYKLCYLHIRSVMVIFSL